MPELPEAFAALRALDACPKCHAVFARPTMPGQNKMPAHFLKAATWAYHCDECAVLTLRALGYGAERIPVFREPSSCVACLEELDRAFKLDRETAGRKVPHPKAVSKIAWCDECVRIILGCLAKPVELQEAGEPGLS